MVPAQHPEHAVSVSYAALGGYGELNMSFAKQLLYTLFLRHQERVDGYRQRISDNCGGLTDEQWEAILYDCQTRIAYNGESLWHELGRYEEAAAIGGIETALARIQYGGER